MEADSHLQSSNRRRLVTRRSFLKVGALTTVSVGGRQLTPRAVEASTGRTVTETVIVDGHRVTFTVPTRGNAYGEAEIRYHAVGPGDGTSIAVSANAYEPPGSVACDSLAPGRLSAAVEYVGSASTERLGTPVRGEPARTSVLTHGYQRHYLQVTNDGDTVWKAQGLGMVTVRMQMLDVAGNVFDAGTETMQMLDHPVYPGDTLALNTIQYPLGPGEYTFRFALSWHDESVGNHFDPGPIFAQLDVPVTVLPPGAPDEPRWLGSTLDAFNIAHLPRVLTDHREFLAHQVVLPGERRAYRGALRVQLPPWDAHLTVKATTSDGADAAQVPVGVSLRTLRQSVATARRRLLASGRQRFVDRDGKLFLSTWYYPYRAARFAADPPARIRQDLSSMQDVGVNVVLLQLFAYFVNTDNLPTLPALAQCRELGLKILPAIYFWNQRTNLSQATGIDLEPVGSGSAESWVDPLDANFPAAMAAWWDTLQREWGDVFYQTADGHVPVQLCDEAGLGIWTRRVAGFSERDIAAFHGWLLERYGGLEEINAAWRTSYASLHEINPQLSMVPQTEYQALWREGTQAVADLDAFRSRLVAQQFASVGRAIKRQHANVLAGLHLFASYGLEGTRAANYYSVRTRNWLAARAAEESRHLLEAETSGVDFLCFTYTGGVTDWEKVAGVASDCDIVPVLYPEFNGMSFVLGRGRSPIWDFSWGWYEIEGVEARDTRGLYAIAPAMIESMNGGGLPGFYSWNDEALFSHATSLQRDEVRLVSSLLQPGGLKPRG